MNAPAVTPTDAQSVYEFWRDAQPDWFAQRPEFDRAFRERFLELHDAAARGALEHWLVSARPALALVILVDQFPRNAFRGTPRMYTTDALARRAAAAAIERGHDLRVDAALRFFFYLPFAHSEDLADQDRSVALNGALGEPYLSRAAGHRDIVRRFGRFPHRNAIVHRTTTEEERRFLENGGYAG